MLLQAEGLLKLAADKVTLKAMNVDRKAKGLAALKALPANPTAGGGLGTSDVLEPLPADTLDGGARDGGGGGSAGVLAVSGSVVPPGRTGGGPSTPQASGSTPQTPATIGLPTYSVSKRPKLEHDVGVKVGPALALCLAYPLLVHCMCAASPL
jgi:hypothetical protein